MSEPCSPSVCPSHGHCPQGLLCVCACVCPWCPGLQLCLPPSAVSPGCVPVCLCVYKACLPARGLLYILLACVSPWFCSGHCGTVFFFIYLSIYLYLWVDGSFAFVSPWCPSLLPSLLGGDGARTLPKVL